jgi:hypothetical protein
MAERSRIVNVPGSGSAAVAVLGTVLARRYTVRESLLKADGVTANTPQGVVVTDQTPGNSGQPAAPPVVVPNPASTTYPGQFSTFSVPDESDNSFHECHGSPLTNGPGVELGVGTTAALPLCSILSATATATAVIVTEIY